MIDKVAKKHNIPKEQVEVIVSDLFKSVREHFKTPMTVKHGVFLNGFVKFKLKYYKIRRYVIDRMSGKASEVHQQASLDYWIELLNQYDKYGNHQR